MRRKIEQNPENSPQLEEVGGKTIDYIERSRTFEPWEKPQVGVRFLIFKQKGEYVEGILGPPITNLRRATSYPIDTGAETVEIFANRLLHRLIQKFELVGSRVRIVYIGRQFISYGGHMRKIFRVYKVKGCFKETLEPVGAKKQAKKRSKKNERAKTNS